MKVETTAKLRFLRMSPRKVRLLIDLIRGLKAVDAVNQLEFSKKQAAKPVLKLLKSAMANAKHNHELAEDDLIVKAAFVDGGAVLKRWMPRAMGRATPIRKRTSHVVITLEGNSKEAKAKKKKEVKKNTDKK